MYGAQMPRGRNNLAFAGMDQRVLNALSEILGQCRSNTKHYGAEEHYGPQTFGDDVTFKNDVLFKEGDVVFGDVNGRGGDVVFNSTNTFNGPIVVNGSITFSTTTLRTLRPQFVELTTNMTTSATAKFKYWDGAAYSDTADPAFTVHDPFKIARNAFSGQQGFALWDFDRSVYVVNSMNAPLVRYGTLDAVLVRDGNETFTDANDGKTFEVYGYMVKSGWRIKASPVRVAAAWDQAANSGAGQWIALATDDCMEVVP